MLVLDDGKVEMHAYVLLLQHQLGVGLQYSHANSDLPDGLWLERACSHEHVPVTMAGAHAR